MSDRERFGYEDREESAEEPRRIDRRDDGRAAYGFLSVEDFDNGERTTAISFDLPGGRVGTMDVTYDPSLVTDALTEQIQVLAEEGDSLAAAEVFCRVVRNWGLRGPLSSQVIQIDAQGRPVYGKDGKPVWEKREIVPPGQPVPLDPDIVQHLRTDITLGVWREINEDVNGGKARKSRRRSRRR